jgi:hypothetical protein
MNASPLVVLSWETPPAYVPPIRLSPRQITTCAVTPGNYPFHDGVQPVDLWTPPGRYDLPAVLRQGGFVERPDLVVVWSSALGTNLPANIAAFDCPKLLIIGDTHHQKAPISSMLAYGRAEGFDAIATPYNRRHLHWFSAAGFGRCAWLPGLTAVDYPRPWRDERLDQVVFVGQTGDFHPHRRTLIEGLKQAGTPLVAGTATRNHAADLYSTSLIAFNASLNGDTNIRVFEILLAGGFLLTDRLAPQAGFDQMLEPGRDYDDFADLDELLAKIAHYRAHPADALRLAAQGEATYRARYMPERQAQVLMDWMLEGRLPALFDGAADTRVLAGAEHLAARLDVYEALQERHRTRAALRVLAGEGWPAAGALDLIDMPRLALAVLEPADATRALAQRAGVAGQIEFLSPAEVAARTWDVVLTCRPITGAEPWTGRTGAVFPAGFG